LDFASQPEAVLTKALETAEAMDGTLDVVHVCAPLPFMPPETMVMYEGDHPVSAYVRFEQDAKKNLDALVERVPGAASRVDGRFVRAGEPAHEVLELLKETPYAMLLVGTHGRRGLSRAVLGSVAEKLVRLSEVPVLSFRLEAG
jgi:nucleotide-binding universal stress UspA family protein